MGLVFLYRYTLTILITNAREGITSDLPYHSLWESSSNNRRGENAVLLPPYP